VQTDITEKEVSEALDAYLLLNRWRYDPKRALLRSKKNPKEYLEALVNTH